MALHVARSAEETLDGVRGGERSLETLRQTHAEHGQRLVEPFPHARGRTRVVSVQAPRQVLQQTLGRLDVAVRVGAREDPPSPTAAVPQGDAPRCSGPYGPDTAAPVRRARMSGSRPCRGPSRHRRSPAGSGRCAARGCRDWSRAPDRPSRSPWPLPTGRACTASGFLDSGLTVFASTPPRPARGGRVAPGPGFGSRTSPASTARCTSA